MNHVIGLPDQILQFYHDLYHYNDRDWWADNRHRYDDIVQPYMVQLLSSLDQQWLPMPIYRPYRNVRFSPDKTPYKTAIGAASGDEHGVLHYVQIGESWVFEEDVSESGLRMARGMYSFSRDQLYRYYDAVHMDKHYDLQRRIDAVSALGYQVGGWQKLSTVPRDYSREHKRAPLLRLGGLTVSHFVSRHDIRLQGDITDIVQSAWIAAEPIAQWLAEFVGPPDL